MNGSPEAQPSTPSPTGGRLTGWNTADGQRPFVPDYELLCRIGSGAYGDVWLARSTLGAYRAIKIVSRLSFERDQPYEREFKGIQRFEPISLTHESQVKILHVGRNEEAGYFYYVMELADDSTSEAGTHNEAPTPPNNRASFAPGAPSSYVPRTLKHELLTRGRLPVDECVQIGLALTTALAHLHEHGLIHRDVKPSNIIFVNGVPKLADIGLVTDIEATRSFVGTEGFIPPEGPGTVGADLYSLGKVLYEISMGRSRLDFPALPTDWDAFPEADRLRLQEFNEVLVKACESDVERRYPSAQQMHNDLRLLQRGESVKQRRAAEQRWALTTKLAIAVGVVGLLVASAFWFRLGPKRVPNVDPRVAKLYELGHHHHSYLDAEHLKQAEEFLNQALEIDPRFVPAYVDLFEIYIWTTPGVAANREEQLEKIGGIAKKLLAINPNQAEGHAALSYCKYLERDWQGAENEIVRAINLNSNYPMAHSLYGYYLSLLGRTDEAIPEVRLGVELDSASSRIAVLITWYPYMASRQFDKAIEQLQRAAELDRNFYWARKWLGRCYEAQSNYLNAIKEYEQADLAFGADLAETKEFYDAWRQAFESKGERGYWEKKLEDLTSDTDPAAVRDSRQIAGCYAKLGQKVEALDEIEKYFNEMTVWNALKFEPTFDSLHDEDRFKALLKRAGLEK